MNEINKDRCKVSEIIFETILSLDNDLTKYSADALTRVLVFVLDSNGWTTEKMVNDVSKSIKEHHNCFIKYREEHINE